MQDRPDASELLEALAAFLFGELASRVPRELRFGVLVAANSAAIVARELAAGEGALAAEAARMRGLIGAGAAGSERPEDREELRALQAEAARAIRAGDLDERWGEAVATLRASVRAKLAVAHPGYDEVADDGRG